MTCDLSLTAFMLGTAGLALFTFVLGTLVGHALHGIAR
jgi:hypothetical protein